MHELIAEKRGAGEDFDSYRANVMLGSVVERQFEVIGEALNQLSKVDSKLAAHVPDLGRVVAFRRRASATPTSNSGF